MQRMKRERSTPVLLPAAVAVLTTLFGACSDHERHSATLVGTIDQESFAYPVTRIITTASDGQKRVTEVDEDGSFAVELEGKQSYGLAVNTDLGTYPLVLAGNHGRYAQELHIGKGGGLADIGSVRFYDPAVGSYAVTEVCIDGYFEGTIEPCMAEQAEVSCRRNRGDGDASSAAWLPLDEPIAVPTFSLPATISCKRGHGDDGHDDDDDGHDDDDRGHDDDD